MNSTAIETLGAVAERQSVLTDPMRRMLDAHGADALVEVVSKHTAFGTFVLSITLVQGVSA